MSEGGAALVAAAKLVLAKVDAVREDRMRSDQPVMVVDVEIILSIGKQLRRPGNLGAVFRNMTFDKRARMLPP